MQSSNAVFNIIKIVFFFFLNVSFDNLIQNLLVSSLSMLDRILLFFFKAYFNFNFFGVCVCGV